MGRGDEPQGFARRRKGARARPLPSALLALLVALACGAAARADLPNPAAGPVDTGQPAGTVPAPAGRADLGDAPVGTVADEPAAGDGGAGTGSEPAPDADDTSPPDDTSGPANTDGPDGGAAGGNGTGDDGEANDERGRHDLASLCDLTEAAAALYGVPQDFFVRLIFQESRFDPFAVSPVGAQGIAQFMPYTARERGLGDAFDPVQALPASASFLAELHRRFGNWGLAAAGYNGGPDRVARWVAGEISGLPYETVNYVWIITGRTVEHWREEARTRRDRGRLASQLALPAPAGLVENSPRRAGDGDALADDPAPLSEVRLAADLFALAGRTGAVPLPPRRPARAAAGAGEATDVLAASLAAVAAPVPRVRPYKALPTDCVTLVAALGTRRLSSPPGSGGGAQPWGAQIAGHVNRPVAMQMFQRVRGRLPADLRSRQPMVTVRRFPARGRKPLHAVQFGAGSREAAQQLCRRISAALVPCVVVSNR